MFECGFLGVIACIIVFETLSKNTPTPTTHPPPPKKKELSQSYSSYSHVSRDKDIIDVTLYAIHLHLLL